MRYNNIYQDGKHYKRANKIKAERLFNEDVRLLVYPVNANPDSPWIQGLDIKKSTNRYNFHELINEIEFYNCNNEMGLYLKFYYIIQE